MPLPITPKTVGLDLGLTSFVVTSDGEDIPNPKYYRQSERKLARAQRRHARKKKGGKNREKARRKVARQHARVTDQRRNYQHQHSHRITSENQVICVESLAVKNMVKIDRWFPSSKTCHVCTYVLSELDLKISARR